MNDWKELVTNRWNITETLPSVFLDEIRDKVLFPMVSLEFFIDIILPAALWPWG
jgi:hypothetical protein